VKEAGAERKRRQYDGRLPRRGFCEFVAMMVSVRRQVWSVLFGGPDGISARNPGRRRCGRQLRRSGAHSIGGSMQRHPAFTQMDCPVTFFAAGLPTKQPLRRRPQAYTARR